MKIIVKTLKATRFELQVNPNDSVADVKKKIETMMGAREYPVAEQTLIHKGKVLKDDTTMEGNDVAERSSIAITKRKPARSGPSSASVRRNTHTQAAADSNGFYYFPEGLSNDGSLDFLRHTQQYQVMRVLVQADEIMLQVIVDAIKGKNPQLYQMIRENKAGIKSLLMEEPYEEDENLKNVSPEEYESFKRLEALGFEESLVADVFLACNKNEEFALKFLLDHNDQFEDYE